jgi:hypothetical protein
MKFLIIYQNIMDMSDIPWKSGMLLLYMESHVTLNPRTRIRRLWLTHFPVVSFAAAEAR